MKSQGGAPIRPTSVAKRRAVLAAAEEAFLAARYDTVTMDEIAAASQVSKQTIYAYFGTKDQLFVDLVASMTARASDAVLDAAGPQLGSVDELAAYLHELLSMQLSTVLQPRMLRLRRLVIGEVLRFPALARAVHDNGPGRAITALAGVLRAADERGLLRLADSRAGATQLNWLVMGEPVNRAMFLGDDAAMSADEIAEHVAAAVALFLDGCGTPSAVARRSPGRQPS